MILRGIICANSYIQAYGVPLFCSSVVKISKVLPISPFPGYKEDSFDSRKRAYFLERIQRHFKQKWDTHSRCMHLVNKKSSKDAHAAALTNTPWKWLLISKINKSHHCQNKFRCGKSLCFLLRDAKLIQIFFVKPWSIS